MAQGVRNDPTVEPSESDYWYAAGFVDGEGCITVRESGVTANHQARLRGWNPSWYASLTISQVDPRPLQWFQVRWGGSLRPLKRRVDGRKDRDAWEWCIVGRQAYRFLEGALPMLKVKDAQARNALRLKAMASGRSRGLTDEQLAERSSVRDEARRLNATGYENGRTWEALP
jgi:hypothetical protein